MKMKKAVKAAIAASMAVAVFGVGAVSFAAWLGGGVPSLPVYGTLGEVEVSDQGFDSNEFSNWTAGADTGSGTGFMTGLVPYDQDAETVSLGSKKIATEVLPEITLGDLTQANAYIFVQSSEENLPEDTTRTDGRFWFKLYDATGETPGAPTCGVDELESNGWKEIGGEDAYLSLAGIGTLNEGKLSQVGIAVIYWSDNLAQEGYGFSFTISLYDPNAAN